MLASPWHCLTLLALILMLPFLALLEVYFSAAFRSDHYSNKSEKKLATNAYKKLAGPGPGSAGPKTFKNLRFWDFSDEPEPGKWAWNGYKKTDRPDSDPKPVFFGFLTVPS